MKKKFVLRIDEDVYNALEKWAADEFRSANGQIEWILAHQLKLNGRYKGLQPKGLEGRSTECRTVSSEQLANKGRPMTTFRLNETPFLFHLYIFTLHFSFSL